MIAFLMCGPMLLGTEEIDRPMERIKYQVKSQITPITRDVVTISSNFNVQELVFTLRRQIDHVKFEYQYEHTVNNRKYEFSQFNRVIELEEPTEHVNLDKLKAKVRSGGKLKKLISSYLES